MPMRDRLERLDDYQQSHRKTGIALATLQKFKEDHSTNYASMIAFWAFFSVFPLMLAFVTLLGWFLPDNSTKSSVLTNVAKMFPLVNVHQVSGLTGSWWALVVGLVSALWSGSAVVRTVQFAFNSVWEIPYTERPKMVEKIKRSFFVLGTLGVAFIVSTVISSFVTGTANGVNLHWFGHLAGYVIAILLDVGIYIAAFRMLTDRDLSIRDVLPGALLSGLVFWILQQLSSFIISRHLHSAQSTYGNFATVITILWWFYLQSIITLLGAQLNVVLHQGMHPRSLVGGPETPADHEAYQAYAQERTYHDTEEVDTTFHTRRPHG